MSKDYTKNLKNSGSAAREYLKPFAGAGESPKPEERIDQQPTSTAGSGEAPHENEAKGDFIDSLLDGKSGKDDLTLTGVYLQADVLKVLNRLAKKGGRGAKSRIVNDALRKVFEEKSLL